MPTWNCVQPVGADEGALCPHQPRRTSDAQVTASPSPAAREAPLKPHNVRAAAEAVSTIHAIGIFLT